MRIGLSAGAPTVDGIVAQAIEAEAAGFSTLWFASGGTAGDPLVAMALAGRATTTLELATGVLQTYPCHPVLMAERVASLVAAVDRPVTIGVGPSHGPLVERSYGLAYDHPGRHTEEYLSILGPLLKGEKVRFEGVDLVARANPPALAHRPSLLVAALASRLLRAAGTLADGTVLWLATPRAVAEHVAPRIRAAAAEAGRPGPRIVAGLPVAVHDDPDEARAGLLAQVGFYESLPNYRRLLDLGGAASLVDACAVGDEAAVTAHLRSLVDAGATDVWASVVRVGDDPSGSVARTHALLRDLAG
ncbi:MAG: TIGR03564 family F420-dependent LLM class oxidoreductase [Acidimicrobiia bacterium]